MLKYAFLGLLQGLTEFLPVSSSGHLVILQKLLGMHGEEIALTVVLHLGTSVALLVFFFKDILKLFRDLKTVIFIAIVTLITGLIGLSGKDFFERLFSQTRPVAFSLLATGILLLLTRNKAFGRREKSNFKDALILGITQGIAVIPGISRSGSTICALLFRGLKREVAFRLSFIAAIPAILGAVILEAKDVDKLVSLNRANFTVGFLASLVTGLAALWLLELVLRKAKLYYFGYYCIIIAILTLIFIK